MSKGEAIVSQIREMALFRQVSPLLNSGVDIKGAMWTREILTYNLNTLIDKFLSSDSEFIDEFLKAHLAASFQTDKKRQLFCFNLVLSLTYFAPKCAYLRLYQSLLARETEYAFYNFFWELKAQVLVLKLDKNNFYADLDHYFLGQKKWQLLLKQSLFFDHKQVIEFEIAVSEKLLRMKRERTVKYISDLVRNEEYNATFFIQEVLDRFLTLYREAKEKEKTKKDVQEGEEGAAPVVVQAVKRATQNRTSRAAMQANNVPSAEVFQAKQVEKERLKTELRNAVGMANKFKASSAKVVSYIQAIDPVVAEVKARIQSQREAFIASRRQFVKGENVDAFSSATTATMASFLDQGSTLYSTNGSAIKRKLLSLSADSYSKLEERSMEYGPGIRALIIRLRRIIFDEQFNLAKDVDSASLEEARHDIDRIFSQYQNLNHSQLIILDTYFNNVAAEPSQADRASQANTILDNVSKKLLTVVERGLETTAEGADLDEQIKQEFETFRNQSSSGKSPQQTDSQPKNRSVFGIKASVLQAKQSVFDQGVETGEDAEGGEQAEAEGEEEGAGEERVGPKISFVKEIQPMKSDFQKKGFFLGKKGADAAAQSGEGEGSGFYGHVRAQSTNQKVSVRDGAMSASEKKQEGNSDHEPQSGKASRKDIRKGSGEGLRQDVLPPSTKLVDEKDHSARKLSARSNELKAEAHDPDLERSVRESQSKSHRESRKLNELRPESPGNPKSGQDLNEDQGSDPNHPVFSSFSRNAAEGDEKRLSAKKQGSQPAVKSPLALDANNSNDRDTNQQMEDEIAMLKEFGANGASGFPEDPTPEGNAEVDADDKADQADGPDESDEGLVDKMRENKFVNTKKGKHIADEIGVTAPDDKKNMKNFFAGFLGKK